MPLLLLSFFILALCCPLFAASTKEPRKSLTEIEKTGMQLGTGLQKVGAEINKAANRAEEKICEIGQGQKKCAPKKEEHKKYELKTDEKIKARELKYRQPKDDEEVD